MVKSKMRVDPQYTYQDYKDNVQGSFNVLGDENYETADKITDWMTDVDDNLFVPNSTSLALWMISLGEYEIRHDILEHRVLVEISYHIPRFQMGKYVEDLSEEEYEQVKADVDYILSKIELVKVKTLEDDPMEDDE